MLNYRCWQCLDSLSVDNTFNIIVWTTSHIDVKGSRDHAESQWRHPPTIHSVVGMRGERVGVYIGKIQFHLVISHLILQICTYICKYNKKFKHLNIDASIINDYSMTNRCMRRVEWIWNTSLPACDALQDNNELVRVA